MERGWREWSGLGSKCICTQGTVLTPLSRFRDVRKTSNLQDECSSSFANLDVDAAANRKSIQQRSYILA